MRVGWLLVLGACGRFGFDPRIVGAGDAGSGDGSGDGNGTMTFDASVSLCPGSTALVCDGFEGPLNARWTSDSFAGNFEIDPSRAYRGASSIHFHTNVISSSTVDPRASLLTSQGLPINGTIYARAWAYFASPNPTTFFDQILNFADLNGTGISFGARDGFIVDNDYATGQYAESTAVLLPLDRWTCLQLSFPSGIAGTARLYVDGAEVTDTAIMTMGVQPAPDHVYVGLEWVGTVTSQAMVDAWLDELVIDSNPTTCAE